MGGFFFVLCRAGWSPGDAVGGRRRRCTTAYLQATTMTLRGHRRLPDRHGVRGAHRARLAAVGRGLHEPAAALGHRARARLRGRRDLPAAAPARLRDGAARRARARVPAALPGRSCGAPTSFAAICTVVLRAAALRAAVLRELRWGRRRTTAVSPSCDRGSPVAQGCTRAPRICARSARAGRSVRSMSIVAVRPITTLSAVIVACMPSEKATSVAVDAVACRK